SESRSETGNPAAAPSTKGQRLLDSRAAPAPKSAPRSPGRGNTRSGRRYRKLRCVARLPCFAQPTFDAPHVIPPTPHSESESRHFASSPLVDRCQNRNRFSPIGDDHFTPSPHFAEKRRCTQPEVLCARGHDRSPRPTLEYIPGSIHSGRAR